MKLEEIIANIIKDIKALKSQTKFFFNDYFDKYSVKKNEKLKVFTAVIDLLKNSVHVDEEYENAVVGMPFNLPYIKGRAKQKKETLEVTEKDYDALTANREFYLAINRGAVVPKNHPKYNNNRVYIKIVDSQNNPETIIDISGTSYIISEETFSQIKQTTIKNLDNFAKIALTQTPTYLADNAIDGYCESICISIGGMSLQINGAVADKTIAKACSTFIETIYKIIAVD